ncbi:MAG: YjdF family protein [Clostridia bacterium]
MEATSIQLTVYYDGQFWIGLFEKRHNAKLSISRYVFGAEPQDNEIYDLILHNWNKLKFSPTVTVGKKPIVRRNPKVLQRKIKAAIMENGIGIGTKAQQAIKLQIEQRKIERNAYNMYERDKEKRKQFLLKQNKKKAKRKGH